MDIFQNNIPEIYDNYADENDSQMEFFREGDIVFEKKESDDFEWTVDPIVEELSLDNLSYEENLAYLEIQREWDEAQIQLDLINEKIEILQSEVELILQDIDNLLMRPGNEVLIGGLEDRIASYELPLNNLFVKKQVYEAKAKRVGIVINSNNDGYLKDDDKIVNPQQILVIDEENGTIRRYPVSLGKAGVKKWDGTYGGINKVVGSTVQGGFDVGNVFDVTETFVGDFNPANYWDATHSWAKAPYSLSKNYYSSNVGMVYKMISIGLPSFYRGQFIHGTNSRNNIGKAASNGCIRMLVEHIDPLLAQIEKSVVYEVGVDGRLTIVENNKKSFAATQRDPQKVVVPGGSPIYIMGKN